jgi:zinc protease
MRAVFPGGLRAETPEVNGISSLWAKSLTRGTATLSAEAVSNLVDALCGGLGASPGRSMLSMRSEFLSRSFERGFELFAQTLIEPAFLEEEVAREKKLQLEDVRARDDRPSTMAFEQLAKLLYRAHPYRMSLVGERNSLEGLDGAQLRSFHQRLVNPANLTLAVVGDVEAKQVLALARQAFGAPGVKAPALVVPVEPAWEGPREGRITLQKAQTHLVLGFPGASVHDAWRRDLEVLVTVLSGQSGRLFMELRDKRSMAYSVSAMSIEGVDPGYFAVYIGTSPEKVNDALAGMKVELQKLLDAPITAQELERAQANLIGSHEIGLQRNGARAGLMAVDQSFGLGADRYHGYAEEISRVTAESVRAVAARVIDFERSALSVVGP